MAQSKSLHCLVGSISFGVINLNHSRSSTALLDQDIASKKLDVICITEPYFTTYGVTSFPKKYSVVAINDQPRTAIVVTTKNINYNIIKCDKDFNIINITYNKDNVIVINMYSPPSSDFEEYVNTLDHYLNVYSNCKIIIVGDFNAKYSIWGIKKN